MSKTVLEEIQEARIADLERLLKEALADATNLREALTCEIEETRRLERALKNEQDLYLAQKERLAAYSLRTKSALEGVQGWLDAACDCTPYDEFDWRGLKILKAWIGRQMRALPQWVLNDKGVLSVHDDIPF